jgi:predicted enzyme involved in methoxymalonyl-ACP biosynthesis
MSRALAAGRRLVVAHTRDASNDYGLVGAALVDPASRLVTHMVVSCRVIGMGIDDALAHCLLRRFGPTLAFDYADSGRNLAVRSFLAGHGSSADDDHAFELRDGLVVLSSVSPPPHVTVTDDETVADPADPADPGTSGGTQNHAQNNSRKTTDALTRAG